MSLLDCIETLGAKDRRKAATGTYGDGIFKEVTDNRKCNISHILKEIHLLKRIKYTCNI